MGGGKNLGGGKLGDQKGWTLRYVHLNSPHTKKALPKKGSTWDGGQGGIEEHNLRRSK